MDAARAEARPRWDTRPIPLALFLSFAMSSCTLIIFAVAVLAPTLQRELGLSTVDFGLFTTIFFLTGAAFSSLIGHVVDRQGAKRSLYGLFGIASLSTLVLMSAPGRTVFLIAAVVGGLSTATGNPTTNRLLASNLRGVGLATAVGVKQAGVPASSFLAGVLLPPIALLTAWQPAVGLIVVLCVVGALIVRTVEVREPIEPADASAAVGDTVVPGLGEHRGQVLRLAAFVLLIGGGLSSVQVYMVLYGVSDVGMPEATAALAVAAMGIAGMISRVVAPRIVVVLGGAHRGLWFTAIGSVGSALMLIAAPRSPLLLFAAAVGFGLTAVAANAVANFVLVSDLPPRIAGRASGTVQTGFYGGFSLAPLLFGWIVERYGYQPAWAMATAIFVAALVLATSTMRDVVPARSGETALDG